MNAHKKGFTIVEMIIVIVVIALLAMITIFSFNSYRARTARTEMKNELIQAAATLKNSRNFANAYPTAQAGFDALYKTGSSVTLTYATSDSGVATYCLRATSANDSTVWYIGNTAMQPVLTTKPAAYCP